MSEAGGQDPRLAGSRAREDKQRPLRRFNGGALFRIQAVEMGWRSHPGTIEWPHAGAKRRERMWWTAQACVRDLTSECCQAAEFCG
ncbi:hypothetical protein ANI02nite_02200 [Acetobacter nitrogenifigens DSM 23921 = NBRC 105050]|uniref:Uncharacterized protein n=1 Tax=Acetobacter nitrogenifigens DSM 23921 = NBRC 105050 TaxID=1120919 RepID=A0A511X5W5_9PROT|nr:hypothetical protein ANI02nite_02200 [Acetobacter nitrogenifigens DSM 23921 = NBRC 105050]